MFAHLACPPCSEIVSLHVCMPAGTEVGKGLLMWQEEAVQLASYSIAFDACFGREGAAGAVAAACSSGGRLEMKEGGDEGSRNMIQFF